MEKGTTFVGLDAHEVAINVAIASGILIYEMVRQRSISTD